MGKSKQQPHHKTAEHDVTVPFPRIFGDTMGPFTHTTLAKYRYVSNVTDQHTKWRAIYLAKRKSDALLTIPIRSLFRWACAFSVLRTDKGGGYLGAEFEDYFLSTGVVHRFTGGKPAPTDKGCPRAT